LTEILTYILSLAIPLALLLLPKRNREVLCENPLPSFIGFIFTLIIWIADIAGLISTVAIPFLRGFAFTIPLLLAYYVYADSLNTNYKIFKMQYLPRDFKIVFGKLIEYGIISADQAAQIRRSALNFVSMLDSPVRKELATFFEE